MAFSMVFTVSLLALAAAPGALSLPFVPPYHQPSASSVTPASVANLVSRFVPPRAHAPVSPSSSSSSGVQPRSLSPSNFKLDLRHNVLTKRAFGESSVRFGSYWFTKATVGDQDVELIVDTGSADLWVVGSVASEDHTSVVRSYNPSLSRTAVPVSDASFNISYGDGNNGMSGSVVQDTFRIGSAAVEGMPVGIADRIEGIDPGIFQSGILGLGFKGGNSIRPNQMPTFMEILSPVLDTPVMVCNFREDNTGSLEFGRVDSSLFQGNLTNLRVDTDPDATQPRTKYPFSWSSQEVTYVVNGSVVGEEGGFDIVFDTGGPSTTGPEDVVQQYYSNIAGAEDIFGDGMFWRVPCDTELPDLEIRFREGQVARIPGSSLLQGGEGVCQTSFGKEGSEGRGLIGFPFFESNVVVFNQQEATISWAPKAR